MEQVIKNIVTLSLALKPGGEEKMYSFVPDQAIVYAKSGYYPSVKKTLCKICFIPGRGLPDVCYSSLSMDDLNELFSASDIILFEFPEGYIRIPLSNHRDGKFEERALNISTIKGIQFVNYKNGRLLKLYLKDKEQTFLFTNISVDEWDEAIERASTDIN
ncbi:MAG: hypothetical protein AB7G44_11445 [Bacteroidia bacterium]